MVAQWLHWYAPNSLRVVDGGKHIDSTRRLADRLHKMNGTYPPKIGLNRAIWRLGQAATWWTEPPPVGWPRGFVE